jgi:hypothetical protein
MIGKLQPNSIVSQEAETSLGHCPVYTHNHAPDDPSVPYKPFSSQLLVSISQPSGYLPLLGESLILCGSSSEPLQGNLPTTTEPHMRE